MIPENGKFTIQKKLVISNIVVKKKVRYTVGALCMCYKSGTIQAQVKAKEKKEDIWLSPMTNAPTLTEKLKEKRK